MTEPVVFNISEAAAYCRVSDDVIRAAYRSGDLTVCYPTGSKRLIAVRRVDLDAWISSWQTAEPVAS